MGPNTLYIMLSCLFDKDAPFNWTCATVPKVYIQINLKKREKKL